MKAYEGLVFLEWWANRWTCFSRVPISMSVDAIENGGWRARGNLVNTADREDIQFLRWVSPMFMVRFHDKSVVGVVLEPSGTGFTLAEYHGDVPDRDSHFVFHPDVDLG
jgi:hypothetical protein